MVTNIIVLLFCFQLAFRAMCPNHELVVFQPQTWTDMYIGSVTNYTFYYNPTAPAVSTNFLYLFISPLYPTGTRIRRVPSCSPYFNHFLPNHTTITKNLTPGHPRASICVPSSPMNVCSLPPLSLLA